MIILKLVPLTRSGLGILDKIQTRIFSISGFSIKFLKNKNCHNSGTSNDIVMKLEPLLKPENRKTMISKKIDDDDMSVNYDVIVNFPIYCQFGDIWKLDSICMVQYSYFIINNDLSSNKR